MVPSQEAVLLSLGFSEALALRDDCPAKLHLPLDPYQDLESSEGLSPVDHL